MVRQAGDINMNVLRAYKTGCMKQISSMGFLLGIIVVAALFFTSTGNIDEWGREYTLFEMMWGWDKETVIYDMVYSPYVMVSLPPSEYFCMFVPFICAFPAVNVLVTEKKSMAYRYNVIRTGHGQYVLGWYMSGIITAGIMVFIAYLMFTAIVFIRMPSMYEFSQTIGVQADNYIATIMWRAAGWFVFGLVTSSVYFLAASIINDIYICMCGVFSLMFIYDIAMQKILAVSNYSKDYLYNFMLSGICNIRYIGRQNIAYAVLIVANAVIIVTVAVRRRGDCGA